MIVAGAGIGGLSCAWELVRRGHEVVVLEAVRSDRRARLHVPRSARRRAVCGCGGGALHAARLRALLVVRERVQAAAPLLSAAGEHPAVHRRQDVYRRRCWPIPGCSPGSGLNRREVDVSRRRHPFPELASLYYAPYLDSFRDEYRPFDAGLNHLDQVSTTDLFRKDGASAGALKFIGGSGSALQSVWHAAILKLRGVPLFPPRVFRLVGGIRSCPTRSSSAWARASACARR